MLDVDPITMSAAIEAAHAELRKKWKMEPTEEGKPNDYGKKCPYWCLVCGMGYKESDNVDRHYRTTPCGGVMERQKEKSQ